MYIPTLKQCMDLAAEKEEFKIYDRGDYLIFDYMISKSDTFDSPVALEMRGIAFDKKTERVISLPFQKFFNLGERPETSASKIDLCNQHTIETKMDGSMIRTIDLGDYNWRLGTRAGVTDIAMMAEEFVADHPTLSIAIYNVLQAGCTAIFEFCSRKNRVVIDHPRDRLVLLAVRDNQSGVYWSRSELLSFSQTFDLDLVLAWPYSTDVSELAATIRDLKGEEGVVITFLNGFKLKIKAEDYVRKHGALDGFRSDKKTLELVLGNDLDDVLPLLDDEMKDRIVRYKDIVYTVIGHYTEVISEFAYDITAQTTVRKEQAAMIFQSKIMSKVASDLFAVLDGKSLNIRENLIEASNQKMRDITTKIGLPLWSEFK